MLKTLLLVVAGLAVGFAAAVLLDGDERAAPAPALEAAPPARSARDDTAAQLGRLQALLEREIAERAALEAQVAGLAAELEELRAGALAASGLAPLPGDTGGRGTAAAPGPPAFDRAARGEAAERQEERLIAGGFTPERAQWIGRRSEELRMAIVQARYDAMRAGGDPGAAAGAERTLREELGDDEYERYLMALGRPTTVNVFDVLASSPAEQAGLASGDQITTYGGKRVFDIRELTELTLEGTPGEPVIVEVRRDGRSLQLVMPRGPVGIAGGAPFGRRGR